MYMACWLFFIVLFALDFKFALSNFWPSLVSILKWEKGEQAYLVQNVYFFLC
jgi:hypothetical protein